MNLFFNPFDADGLKTFRPEGSKNFIEYLTFDEFIEVEAQDLSEMFDYGVSEGWLVDTKEDWQEFCLEVYQNEAPTLAYTTEEQFEIICSLDDRIPPIGNLAEIDLIQEIEAFLRPVLDGLRDRKELKSIIGIDRMSHQDAQTFKKIADEIIKSETVNLFAHCDDCNSPISTSEYSSCDECGKDLCPDCFTGNEYQIICSGCYQEQEA